MKLLSVHLAAFVAFLPLFGQELIRDPSTGASDATIPGPIADGTTSPPLPPALPDFKIKSTVVREVDVVEPPPMAGLPPVTGTITETVHLVEDPKLPDPPPPPTVTGGQLPTNFTGVPNKPQEILLSLSATVYDHSRTLLRYHPRTDPGKEVLAWSNLDFNHFSGFAKFSITGGDGETRSYVMMGMGLSNEDTQARTSLMAKFGKTYVAPVIPTIPDVEPAYVIVNTNPDAESVKVIADLHQLYRNEGTRMKDAYLARINAVAEQRAYLLANPPAPKDVTINFWERDHPVGLSADTIKKAGGN